MVCLCLKFSIALVCMHGRRFHCDTQWYTVCVCRFCGTSWERCCPHYVHDQWQWLSIRSPSRCNPRPLLHQVSTAPSLSSSFAPSYCQTQDIRPCYEECWVSNLHCRREHVTSFVSLLPWLLLAEWIQMLWLQNVCSWMYLNCFPVLDHLFGCGEGVAVFHNNNATKYQMLPITLFKALLYQVFLGPV